MSEEKKDFELKDEELKRVTGGTAGDDISYCGYSVKENGVYTDGKTFIFVISLNSVYGGQTLDTLRRTVDDGIFTTGAYSNTDAILAIANSYQFVCVTTEQTFRNAKNVSEL